MSALPQDRVPLLFVRPTERARHVLQRPQNIGGGAQSPDRGAGGKRPLEYYALFGVCFLVCFIEAAFRGLFIRADGSRGPFWTGVKAKARLGANFGFYA